MQGITLRTLDGYGINGIQLEYPNGTKISIKHNLQGEPEIFVEGAATVTQRDDSHVRILH